MEKFEKHLQPKGEKLSPDSTQPKCTAADKKAGLVNRLVMTVKLQHIPRPGESPKFTNSTSA
ncbi:hypothetical protein CsSME_00038311 [Camellia sinensis var. sinensis]